MTYRQGYKVHTTHLSMKVQETPSISGRYSFITMGFSMVVCTRLLTRHHSSPFLSHNYTSIHTHTHVTFSITL